MEIPSEWLGYHVDRRDKALAEARESGIKSSTLQDFAVALALAEDWGNIPGLDGPPDQWDFQDVPLPLIAWMIATVVGPFADCFRVPKVSSSQSQDGSSNSQIQGTTLDPTIAEARATEMSADAETDQGM